MVDAGPELSVLYLHHRVTCSERPEGGSTDSKAQLATDDPDFKEMFKYLPKCMLGYAGDAKHHQIFKDVLLRFKVRGIMRDRFTQE